MNERENFATACTEDVAQRFEEVGFPLSFAAKVEIYSRLLKMIHTLPVPVYDKMRELYEGKPE